MSSRLLCNLGASVTGAFLPNEKFGERSDPALLNSPPTALIAVSAACMIISVAGPAVTRGQLLFVTIAFLGNLTVVES